MRKVFTKMKKRIKSQRRLCVVIILAILAGLVGVIASYDMRDEGKVRRLYHSIDVGESIDAIENNPSMVRGTIEFSSEASPEIRFQEGVRSDDSRDAYYPQGKYCIVLYYDVHTRIVSRKELLRVFSKPPRLGDWKVWG